MMSGGPTIKEKGFTLLEVVVAMSILVIGILATINMGMFSVRNVTSGNVVTQANLLAQARIEQIKHVPDIKDLQGIFVAENDVRPVDGDGQPIEGGGVYDIAYSFTDPLLAAIAGPTPDLPNCQSGNNDGSGTCLAAVTVSWQRGFGGRGGRGQVRLHTLTHGDGI